MSGSSTTGAPLRAFGPLRAGDIDLRGRDWTTALQDDGDRVQSVVTVQITRKDGQAMGASDLVWRPPAIIDVSGQITSIWLSSGVPGVTYIVGIEIKSAKSKTLWRDALLTVVPTLG